MWNPNGFLLKLWIDWEFLFGEFLAILVLILKEALFCLLIRIVRDKILWNRSSTTWSFFEIPDTPPSRGHLWYTNFDWNTSRHGVWIYAYSQRFLPLVQIVQQISCTFSYSLVNLGYIFIKFLAIFLTKSLSIVWIHVNFLTSMQLNVFDEISFLIFIDPWIQQEFHQIKKFSSHLIYLKILLQNPGI